jgi:hypothetical protein
MMIRTRTAKLLFITLGTIVLACSVLSAPALARRTRPSLFSFNAGTRVGGLAIDQTTQNVYVPNTEANTVEVFNSEGGPPADGLPSTLTGADSPNGGFNLVHGGRRDFPAVDNACFSQKLSGGACESADPSNGDIYIPDINHDVVDKFRVNNVSHQYEYVCQFTGYTPAGGVECLPNLSGKEKTQEEEFSTPSVKEGIAGPEGVTVDSNGDVYVCAEGSAVYEFNAAGEPVTKLESPSIEEVETRMAIVDPTGNVYVAGEFGHGGSGGAAQLVNIKLSRSSLTGPVEGEAVIAGTFGLGYEPANSILFDEGLEYNTNMEVIGSLGFSGGVGVIVVNETTGNIYVTTAGGVSVFGPPIVIVEPNVFTEGPLNVGSRSATLTGSVAPEGTVSKVRFEYNGLSVPASPVEVSGNTTVSVTANIVGLQPNSTYIYRLVASGTYGTVYGSEQALTTPPVAPSLDSQSSSGITQSSAILNALINPNNQQTTYRIQYGPSPAYGTTIPVPDGVVGSGFGDVGVGQSLAGLTPGTTYHYRVITENETGIVEGPDQTFTTLRPLPPIVATTTASGVSQNSATISGAVDPQGVQSTYEFEIGPDTGYGTRIYGDAGSGSQPESVSVTLAGLAAGTTYHYRLISKNEFGIVYGADQTFTTPGYPTAIITAPVTPVLIGSPPFTPPTTTSVLAKTSRHAPVHKASAHITNTHKKKHRKKTKRHTTNGGRRGNGRRK